MKLDNLSAAIIFGFLVLDFFVWRQILFFGPPTEPRIVFLDVGQGDATLLVLPGGIKILTDAGPSRQIVNSLEKIAGGGDRYIDLAIISHPQLDHFNGFNYLLNNYRFGAFISNGREANIEEWRILMDKIKDKKLPLIVLGEGDRIRHLDSAVDIISPDDLYVQSAELNDTSIVQLIKTSQLKVLLTGDIGFGVENYLVSNFDIRADVLKIPHHGSKNSSGGEFLDKVSPKIAVIQTGAGNRYGHPTKEALSRVLAVGAKAFRTDVFGNIELIVDGRNLRVFTEK